MPVKVQKRLSPSSLIRAAKVDFGVEGRSREEGGMLQEDDEGLNPPSRGAPGTGHHHSNRPGWSSLDEASSK